MKCRYGVLDRERNTTKRDYKRRHVIRIIQRDRFYIREVLVSEMNNLSRQ